MKRFNLGLMAAAALSVLTVAGCNKDDVLPGNQTTAEADGLSGTFDSDPNTTISTEVRGFGCVKNEMKVELSVMTITQTAYDGVNCDGTAYGQIITHGRVDIGSDLPNVGPNVKELNWNIDKVSVKPMDKGWTNVFTGDVSGDCKLADLPLNQEYEVTGMDCKAFGVFPAKDYVYYTSFQTQGNVINFSDIPSKKWGNVGTKDNPASRNTDLNWKYTQRP